MKLSVKFFCIAYILVLLTTGCIGSWLIYTSKSSLISSERDQADAATKYAADSFISFSETTTEKISQYQLSNLERRIKNSFGNTEMNLEIIPEDKAAADYMLLEAGEGFSRFELRDGATVMENVYRADSYGNIYYIVVSRDFTAIDSHYERLWFIYGTAVLVFAVLSGGMLFLLIRKITKPLYKLCDAANNIAVGDYGKTIEYTSKNPEIQELADSFNRMSLTISEKIQAIEEELSARDTFVSSFTHELKTPMTAIIGYSQMLNSYMLNDKEKRQAVNAIHKESTRLEKLAMQLLDLYIYKNESVEFSVLSLQSIGTEVITTLGFTVTRYKVKLVLDFKDCAVVGNKQLLLSLLYNLVDNALKASPAHSEVKLYSTADRDTVRIYVEDNGKGVAKENIKHLTEPFFREDKARSRALGGAGLGLSLCQKIAEIHGTSLNIQSEINKGTTVSFELKRR